jgi:N-acetylmuramoyl-L-alanine amidase
MPTGNEILELATTHIGERYILGARVPFGNPNYKGPWDCAEFVSWCIFQISGLKVGTRKDDAYTGYWKTDASLLCNKISIDEAKRTPGAILLRYPITARTGHIVFSDGLSKTVEAKGEKFGVVSDAIDDRDWDTALLVKGIIYTQNAIQPNYQAPTVAFKLRSPIMQDSIVRQAKLKLKSLGIDPGTIDDAYDSNMEIAVYNYQLIEGLVTDGIMGNQTLSSLGLA